MNNDKEFTRGNDNATVRITFLSSNTSQGTVSPSGTQSYEKYATVTVTAIPKTGYKFSYFLRSDTGAKLTSNPYSFSASGNNTITAYFETKPPTKYSYSSQVSGTGGTVSGSGTAEAGTSVTVKATASSGYTFDYWSRSSDSTTSNNATWTFSMPNKDVVCYAHFKKIPTYSYSSQVSGTGGTVSGSGTAKSGDQVTVKATPSTGYDFDYWSRSSDSTTSTNSSWTFSMPAKDVVCYAHFKIKQFTLYLGVDPTNAGTVTGAGTYDYNTEVTISATAKSGYRFDHWTDGDTNATRTITITSTTTLVAYFVRDTYMVTVVANPSGGGSVSGGGQTIPPGTRTAVIAVPNTEAHYHFNYWYRSDGETYDQPRWDFTVNDDYVCTANFSLDTYHVYLGVDPSGAGTVSGAGEYTWGSPAHIVATANNGYRFLRWTDGSTDADRYINVYSTTTLVAYFEKIPQKFTFSKVPQYANVGIWEIGEYQDLPITEKVIYADETFRVEARDHATSGYRFKNWDNSPALTERVRDFSWTGSYDRNYTAYFEYVGRIKVTVAWYGEQPPGYAEVISAKTLDGSYLVYPSHPDDEYLTQETYLTFKVTQLPGYVFDHWERNGTTISIPIDRTEGSEIIFEPHLIYGAEGTSFRYVPKFREVSPTTFYTIDIDSNKYPNNEGLRYYGDVRLLRPGASEWEITTLVDQPYHADNIPEGTWVIIHHADGIYVNGEWFFFTAWSDTQPDNIYGELGRQWTSLTDNIDLTMNFGEAKKVTCIAQPETGGYFGLRLSGSQRDDQTGYDFIVGKDRQVIITAYPYPGYDFVRWEDTGSIVPARQETITDNCEFNAVFSDNGGTKQQFHVSASSVPEEGGYLLGEGWYDAGKSITVFATANKGFKFKNWNTGETHYSKDLRMTKDYRFTLYFTGAPIPPTPGKLSIYNIILKKRKNKKIHINT